MQEDTHLARSSGTGPRSSLFCMRRTASWLIVPFAPHAGIVPLNCTAFIIRGLPHVYRWTQLLVQQDHAEPEPWLL